MALLNLLRRPALNRNFRWSQRLFFACFVLIGACTSSPKPIEIEPLPVYPPPPATARFVYEHTLYSANQVEITTQQDRLKQILTGVNGPDSNFVKPLDIAAYKGRLYISDSLGGMVHVLDLPRRRYFILGYRFEGKLSKPTGMNIDQQGRLYVADTSANRIVVYDSLGLFMHEIKGEQGILERPVAVAINPDGSKIYVVDNGGVDTNEHRIVVFDSQGQRLFEFAQRGHADGELNLPSDIEIGSDGKVYVLDAGNFRVQIFSPDGKFLRYWGSVGRSFGQFARPRHMSIDAEDNLYISDAFFGNFQIFNSQGALLLSIGKNGEDKPGQYGLIAGISVDETGRIYTVDQIYKKIDVYRPASN